MRRVAGAGNDRGHARISKKEFKEELRPAAGKASCSIWYQLAEHRLEQAAATKWQSREYGRVYLSGRRQDPLFRLAVVERIVDLNKIRLLATQHLSLIHI